MKEKGEYAIMNVKNCFLPGTNNPAITKTCQTINLSQKTVPRDTNLRDHAIKESGLLKYISEDKSKDFLSSYDWGHLISRTQGGDNSLQNGFWEIKQENRAPGLKRQIEQECENMMLGGKKVTQTICCETDNRLLVFKQFPISVFIETKTTFRNGKEYSSRQDSLDASPYLAVATLPEIRGDLCKATIKCGTEGVAKDFIDGTMIAYAFQQKKNDSVSVKKTILGGIKITLPEITKVALKCTMAGLQTSKRIAPETRKNIAKMSVNPTFNSMLNVAAKIAKSTIIVNEINKV